MTLKQLPLSLPVHDFPARAVVAQRCCYLVSEQGAGPGLSEGIAPRRHPHQQGVLAGVLHAVLLELGSCLGDLCEGKEQKKKKKQSREETNLFASIY